MRILAVRLHNIASLGGPWCIDFTTEPLKSSHLFAITGPTGAGKSTLLDALCLALYGSTPRLRTAPQRESSAPDIEGEALNTADPRTLLRRGESSGYAEVDFRGADGCCYRACWRVRRARHRPGGRLQGAEQSLTSLPDGQILTAQKREFDRLVQERLGLSFDQFTRAVLLAQNEFGKFLCADDNQRSELLEKLTDTGIYSTLSSAAFRRTRDCEHSVKELEARLGDRAPAEPEARRDLKARADDTAQHLDTLARDERTLSNERAWLDGEKRLLDHCQKAERAHRQALEAQRESAPRRETLSALTRLAPKRHLFEQRERERASLERLLPEVERLSRACTAAAQEASAQERRFEADTRALEKAQAERLEQQPAIDACARTEEQKRHRQEALSHHQKRLEALEKSQQERQTALYALNDQRQTLESELAALDERRRRRANETGKEATAGPGEWRQHLQRDQDRIRYHRQQLENLQRALSHLSRVTQRYRALEASIRDEQNALSELERQGRAARHRLNDRQLTFKTLRERFERLRLARSESVTKLRETLERDSPCPVCGSLAHPFAERPVETTPERVMLEATEREEKRQLDEATSALERAETECATLRAAYSETAGRLEQRRRQHPALENEYEDAVCELRACPPALSQKPSDDVFSFHDEAPSPEELSEATEALHQKEIDLARQIEQHDADERARAPLMEEHQQLLTRRAALESDDRNTRKQIETEALEASSAENALKALEATLSKELGAFESAARWRTSLEETLKARAGAQDRSRTALEAARQHHQGLLQKLEQTGLSRQEAQNRLEALESEIHHWRCAHPDIDDERLAALLEVDEGQHGALIETIEALDAAVYETQQQMEARKEVLNDHRLQLPATAKVLPSQIASLAGRRGEIEAQLEAQQKALTPSLLKAREARDEAVHALRDDDERRARAKEIESELESRRRELVRWGRISGLIGSADGRAFRRIAQGFHLEQLIEYANVHLSSLARRYRLARGGSELGLLVIDTEMGDERRSVHSLSGGETFLVSLALALSLSSMTSSGLSIESLFIDEGFGTLDPASLAQVMDALDALQSQGRRVGVISHVQEMHERIPVQVQILPRGSGQSVLAVRRLAGGEP